MHDAPLLARLWRLLAISALGAAACIALLLVVARAPGVGALLPSITWFRTGLVLHVDLAVVVWLLGGCAYYWSAASAPRARALGRMSLVVAGVCALALPLCALTDGAAHLSNYLPFVSNRGYVGALLGFAAAVALTYLRFLLWPAPESTWRLPRTLTGVPVIVAALSLAWSARDLGHIDAGAAEVLTWGAGHTLLLAYVCAMMLAWMDTAQRAGIEVGARWVHATFVLQVLPAIAVPAIHLFLPIEQSAFREAFTSLMRWSAWPGALLLAACLMRAYRAHGPRRLDPAFVLSLSLFAIGLLLGATIRDDTSVVPAHYHATVGAITVALMRAATLAPAERRRLGSIDIPVYGTGILLLALALAWSGWHGVSRKAPLLSHPLTDAPQRVGMAVVAVGGALAIAGVLAYVLPQWRNAIARVRARVLAHVPARFPARFPAHVLARRAARLAERRDRRPVVTLATLAGIVAVGALVAIAPRSFDALARPRDRDEQIHAKFDEAVALMRRGELESASIALHSVLVLSPQMPEAHVNMGFVLLGRGRPQAALGFFESATALRTRQDNAYYGLAVAYEALGDLPAAVGAMRTFVHLADKNDPFVRKGQAALWEWETQVAAQRKSSHEKVRAK